MKKKSKILRRKNLDLPTFYNITLLFILTMNPLCLLGGNTSNLAKDSIFEWHGKSLEGILKSKEAVPVQPNSIIKANVSWQILQASPGSYAVPCIIFESSGSKEISSCVMTKRYPHPRSENIIEAEDFFTVPENANQARLAFLFKGNPISIKLTGYNIQKQSARPKESPQSYPVIKHEGAMLSDKQLDEMLTNSKRLYSELKTEGDLVSLYINNKRIIPKIYKTSSWAGDTHYDMLQAFYGAGFNIFTVKISIGVGGAPSDIWKGQKLYDIDKIRKAVCRILSRVPEAMIMLELRITPPRGWARQNPDEIFQHIDGRKGVYKGSRIIDISHKPPAETGKFPEFWHPSYYSEKYNNEVAEVLYDIFSQLETTPESKRIIGVYLNGGTDVQWIDLFDAHIAKAHLVADYSPAALKAFQKYLKFKYNDDIKKLNKSWESEDVSSFEEVKIPKPDELWRKENSFHSTFGASRTSDYCEFLGYANAMRHIKWCRAVKDAAKRRLLTGSYSPSGGLSAFPLLSQQNAEWLIPSKEVDFFAVVPGYNREFYNPVIMPIFNGSMILHNKLLIAELDLRTPEVGNWGLWGGEFWKRMHDSNTFCDDIARFISFSATQGGTFHAYDMDGGWFNTKNAIEAWKAGCLIYDQASPQCLDSNRIAVVASERYWDFQSFYGDSRFLVYNIREFPKSALACSGVRYDYYLLSDVFDNELFKAPKVLMFTDACTVKEADSIRRKYGNSGRVLVWFWAPGLFVPGGEENLSKITNFKLERANEADGKPIFIKNNSDPLVNGVDGFLISHIPDWKLMFGPAWKVSDPDAEILGNYWGTDIPGMAVKRHKFYTEIYIGQPGALSPQLLRNIAISVGIKPLADSNDIMGYGGDLLYLTALTSGCKTIHLPKGSGKAKCLTGETLCQKGNTVNVDVHRGNTIILKLNNNCFSANAQEDRPSNEKKEQRDCSHLRK